MKRATFVFRSEVSMLLFTALGHIEVGQRFDDGEHRVTRLAVAGVAVVPHSVDLVPNID